MDHPKILQQLRAFLAGVAAFIFVGTIAELYLLEHYKEVQQWIPLVLSFIGLVELGIVWLKPSSGTLKLLRWTMVVVALASLYGMYLHFMGNFSFALEINPSLSSAEAIWPAIKGSNPLLAPGMLFVGALLGAASTYRHSLLRG